jgi:hypothetical protein
MSGDLNFHRRVIWTLLATHSIVFVGFSMRDSFFMDVINVWKKDFDLHFECPHFAIMPISANEDCENKKENLRLYGVKSLFYEVPQNSSDHSGLDILIAEIAELRGVRVSEPAVNMITRQTLGLK